MNAPAYPTPKFLLQRGLLLLATLFCLACSSVLPQTPSPDYTNDLPSVERVKAEIKGSDPTDTLARQVAVFTYLYTYVDRIKLNRDYRGPYTPGETRVMTAYRLAAYQISQDYAKSHTPAEAAAFERLHGQYEMNSEFYKDWSKRLIGPQSAAAYKGAEAGLAATQKAHIDSINRANQEAQAQAQAHSTNPQGLSNDPTAVATRRCLELGGSNIACMGKSFMNGIIGMAGINMDALTDSTRPAGVVLSGQYKGSPGAGMAFNETLASTTSCGDLTPVGYPYNIQKQGTSIRVLVHNEPNPFTLTMRPDGGFTGPGLINVTGKVIVGYDTVTKTQMIDGRRAMFDECNGPCQTTSSVPRYAPKTERCTVGSLSAPPKRKPEPAQPAQPAGAESGLLGMLTETFNTGEMTMNAEDGFRMVGKYSGGRLLLDFTPTSVILDCDQAHIRSTYTVENAPITFIVHIDNPAGPIALAVQPDNSLRGSGSTTINGRLVTGMQGDQVTFTPTRASCELSTFQPQNGNTGTKVAAAAEPPPPATRAVSSASTPAQARNPYTPAPASTATNTPAPASPPAANTPALSSGSRAAMRVLIAAEFPSGANPMAGQSIFIMRERMDEVLRKLGVPVPPNGTPGKAMQTLATSCKTMDCRPVMSGLGPYYVTTAKLDNAGKATLSATAATGPYFLFAIVRTPDGASLIWDIPATLHAGDNTITLTPANAETIH
jgi:hypothetical protein